MKVVKAALCALFSFAVILLSLSRTAQAAGSATYAMALTDDVYIYDEMERNTELFALPATYCVEILREYDDWYRVAYGEDDGFYEEIIGYCKKDNLLILADTPQNPYLNYPVQVTLTSGEDKKYGLPALELTVTAAFYGNFYRANTPYIYLKYNGVFGYVEGEIYGYEKNEIPSAPTFSEGNGGAPDGDGAVIPALIIAALAAAAVIVLIFTGRKGHKKQ